ncbi:MAG: Hpt domain-containing protein [Planctomycetaceae bacterium]
MSHEPPSITPSMESSSRIINRQAALTRLGGSEQLFNDMVGFFREDAPQLSEAARQAVTDQDDAETRRTAHSLKGLAANIEASEVVRLAQQLEDLGRTGQLDEAPAVLHALNRAVADVMTASERSE